MLLESQNIYPIHCYERDALETYAWNKSHFLFLIEILANISGPLPLVSFPFQIPRLGGQNQDLLNFTHMLGGQ